MQLILLELNEVNFDHLRVYARRERGLPHLEGLIRKHGICETTSEVEYHELEPWIQWVTAHTGLPLSDHGVFRLGDIEKHDYVQIWEFLEHLGFQVGAVSPMNANNRTRNAAFFVPDPWTSTRVTASSVLRNLYGAVRQFVNDNAQARLSPVSAIWLALGSARYARLTNYLRYAALLLASAKRPWARAMFLDLLLADVFIREVKRSGPQFASLFLNAAAHIQHHYMFNSTVYNGDRRNPDWYISPHVDPVAEVYRLYDRIVGEVQRLFPEARLMIATGLHQDPHEEATFYWRLRDHVGYLRKLGIPFQRVNERMSRDFTIECASTEEASTAERMLSSIVAESGETLFEVDNRGRDLFVMLVWPHDIGPEFAYSLGSSRFNGLRDEVVFVAIKNGRHNGTGYFIDSGLGMEDVRPPFPLTDIPSRICNALGVRWFGSQSADSSPVREHM